MYEIEVTDENFNEKVIEQSKKIPILADFYADWCGPCNLLKPILEKIAKEYKGKFILAKINIDKCILTTEKYNIMSVPSVKLFKNGKIINEFIGLMPEEKIKEWLNKNLR
ncbi:MAG: thioredoxin [Candidatus Aenigmatarchaeota archaeon]|nr:thioredoxin [Candidatus Aenigmarchaeota archaeon]